MNYLVRKSRHFFSLYLSQRGNQIPICIVVVFAVSSNCTEVVEVTGETNAWDGSYSGKNVLTDGCDTLPPNYWLTSDRASGENGRLIINLGSYTQLWCTDICGHDKNVLRKLLTI